MSDPFPSTVVERTLKRANPSTIQGKFLVGYQGWFTCAGDGEPIAPGHHGWLHWFNKPIPSGGHPNIDLWPDVSSYDSSELYPAPGLKTRTGEDVFLFSSRNPKTVQRHFRWMAEHGVDGAFLQRFAGQCDPASEGIRRVRDEVGDRVREAAEREGRVFAIMYDVTGVPAERIQHILVQDWLHLIRHKRILDSPSYLKENGKPVVALWGFGFDNAGHTPALLRAVAQFFRNTTPGGVYLMAGTPTHWRTSEGDCDRNPDFASVWLNEFDAISPWTIGRYKTEEEAESFAENKMKGDFQRIQQHNSQAARKVDYIPVIFPGSSGCNMSEGKWGFNDAPRKGGRFLWKQVFNAHRVGARIFYGAMWDEYDEGTAFMPAIPHKHKLPVSDKWQFMALDQDGHDIPSDWYMRICGFAAEVLRGERRLFETFPSKELHDYWATRPKYEDRGLPTAESSSTPAYPPAGSSSSTAPAVSAPSASPAVPGGGPSNQGGQSYEEWLESQKTQQEDVPPPPYTLEVEEPIQATTTPSASPAVGSAVGATSTSSSTPVHPGPTVTAQPQHSEHPPVNSGPPANAQTYPAGQGYGASPNTNIANPTGSVPSDPVANLTNDFGRFGLGGTVPAGPPTGTYQSGNISASPPPIHPGHTGAHQGRPPTSRPTTAGVPPPVQGLCGRPQSAQANAAPAPTPCSTGTWSQPQWPPADWQVSGSTSAAAPSSNYGGANLSRPQTFTASSGSTSLHHSSSLRPHTSVSGRPQSAQANPAPLGYGNAAAYPPANPTGPPTPCGNVGSGPISPTSSVSLHHPSSLRPHPSISGRPHSAQANPAPGCGGATAYPHASTSGPPIPYGNVGSGPASPTGPTSLHHSSSLRPHPSISGRPQIAQANTTTTSGYGDASAYPPANVARPPAPYGPAPSTYGQPQYGPYGGMPTGPSGYGHPQPAPYGHPSAFNFPDPNGPARTSTLDDYASNASAYLPYHSGAPLFPASSYPSTSHTHNSGQGVDYTAHPPTWSGGPSPPISPGSTNAGFPNDNAAYGVQPPSSYPQGPTFPYVVGGDDGQYGNTVMPQVHSYYQGPPGPYGSDYLNPQHGGMPSSYQPASASSFPAASHPSSASNDSTPIGNQSMPWMPAGPATSAGSSSNCPPPALPPRPSNYSYGSSSSSSSSKPSGMNFPAAGAGALGFAWSAVDKVAGRKTREQLEREVGSLASSGTKLFNKLTK